MSHLNTGGEEKRMPSDDDVRIIIMPINNEIAIGRVIKREEDEGDNLPIDNHIGDVNQRVSGIIDWNSGKNKKIDKGSSLDPEIRIKSILTKEGESITYSEYPRHHLYIKKDLFAKNTIKFSYAINVGIDGLEKVLAGRLLYNIKSKKIVFKCGIQGCNKEFDYFSSNENIRKELFGLVLQLNKIQK